MPMNMDSLSLGGCIGGLISRHRTCYVTSGATTVNFGAERQPRYAASL
jgi:hypothetical protein